MKIEFDVQMDVNTLYDYSLRHTYNSSTGLIGTVVGFLMIASYFKEQNLLFLLFGIITVVYLPVAIYINCKKQMKMVPHFKYPLHYTLDESGVWVSQGDNSAGHEWSKVLRAVSTKKSIILYTGRNIATILPRDAMGENLTAALRLIASKIEPKKNKIRF